MKEIINAINEKYENVKIYYVNNDVIQDTLLKKNISYKLGLNINQINFVKEEIYNFIPDHSIYFINNLSSEIHKVNLYNDNDVNIFFKKISEFKLFKIKYDSLQKKLFNKILTLKFENNSFYLLDKYGKFLKYDLSDSNFNLVKSIFIKNSIPDYDTLVKYYLKQEKYYPIYNFKKFSKEDMISYFDFDMDNNFIYYPIDYKFITKENTDTFYIKDQTVIAIFDKNMNFKKILTFKKFHHDKICNSFSKIIFKNDTAFLSYYNLINDKFYLGRYFLRDTLLVEDTSFKIKLNIKLSDEITTLFKTDKHIYFLHPSKNHSKNKIYKLDLLNKKLVHIYSFKKGFIPVAQNYFYQNSLVFIQFIKRTPIFYKLDLSNYKAEKIKIFEIQPDQLKLLKYKHIFISGEGFYYLL